MNEGIQMNENEIRATNAVEMIDVSDVAYEVGYPEHLPMKVCITPRVFMKSVYWKDEDSQKQVIQFKEERLWHLLYNSYQALAHKTGKEDNKCHFFNLEFIPRDGVSQLPISVKMKIEFFLVPGERVMALIQEQDENW